MQLKPKTINVNCNLQSVDFFEETNMKGTANPFSTKSSHRLPPHGYGFAVVCALHDFQRNPHIVPTGCAPHESLFPSASSGLERNPQLARYRGSLWPQNYGLAEAQPHFFTHRRRSTCLMTWSRARATNTLSCHHGHRRIADGAGNLQAICAIWEFSDCAN